MIDIKEIINILPHRYPFLLVDRIIECIPNERVLGLKNVTINEYFFQGHFPGNPIMPGVLIIEAMAQVAGVLVFKSGTEGSGMLFMSIERAKFRKPIIPGDQIIFEISVAHRRGNVWKFSGIAKVEGKVAAEAEFSAIVTK